MAHTVIGTAGHIDHGKTLLVKALTGMETDRAPEEKSRGITIELGFAFLGDQATIIDVPGHERFVKTMVAGVSTIDLALLVIAADDGVMPQSREHLDVLQLMGVPRGLIALNKIDLADEEWADLVEEEIRELVEGTFLEEAEIVRVSAQTGEGIEDLKQRLIAMMEETSERRVGGGFRLAVDRAFVSKGFGLVCTGTVLSGRLHEGDTVEVQPEGRQIRVRGLQQHGESVQEVMAGDRAAINLPGVEKEEIVRGDVLASPDYLHPTYMLDARLHLLPSCPRSLGHRARVRLHLGTREALARVVLLDREELQPGDDTLVQLRLETPVVAVWGDRFVIRRYSPALTIGGGMVLDPHPMKHRRAEATVLAEQLEALEQSDASAVVEARLRHAREGFKSCQDLAGELGLGVEQSEAVVQDLESAGRVVRVQVDNQVGAVHVETWESLSRQIEEALQAFHAENPLKQGLNREELRLRSARYVQLALFEQLVQALEKAGRVRMAGALVCAAAHTIQFTPEEEQLKEQIETALKSVDLASAPDAAALASRLKVDRAKVEGVLAALQSLGTVISLEGGLLLHGDTLDEVRQKLRQHLEGEGEITVSGFRDLIEGNRRYALALLNFFDGEGLTERREDMRVLRG